MFRSPAQPRISANELATFMVSSDSARHTIIKRSANPSTFIVARYKDAKAPIRSFLTDQLRNPAPLYSAEAMFAQRADDPAESSWRQEDALQSIEALRALQSMSNQLAGYTFADAPMDQPKLVIAGVEVSVRCDLLTLGVGKSADQIGGAILRLTQDDAETETAISKRREIGLFTATLVWLQMAQSYAGSRKVATKLCMSVDARHGQIFTAPASNSRKVKDLEAACRTIAALWPSYATV